MTVPVWYDDSYRRRPPLSGDVDVDVLIVGGGVGGLSTAWHLAEQGVRSTVVDADCVAGGASGRNGGFLIAGTAPFHADARRLFGAEPARRMHQTTLDAQVEIAAIAADIGAADCFRWVGGLRLAMDAAEAVHCLEEVEALRDDGLPGAWVPEEELPAVVRRPGRAGVFRPGDAAMHPARWIRRLGDALARRGCTIYDGTAVAAPIAPPIDGAFRLPTPGGSIRAERVVIASDGFLPELVPLYAGAVRGRRLHMIATGPLAERIIDVPIYARYGHDYVQQLPDGRLALGGFSDLDGDASYTTVDAGSSRVFDRLERWLDEELDCRAAITHRWVGIVGFSAEERPYVGAVPGLDGLYVAGGYSGTGNLNGFVAGRIVAELIATGDSPDDDLYDASRVASI